MLDPNKTLKAVFQEIKIYLKKSKCKNNNKSYSWTGVLTTSKTIAEVEGCLPFAPLSDLHEMVSVA